LGAIGDQSGNELALITFDANATDADLPANTLTFSLDAGAPAGAAIDPSTGAFTWTPDESQGPGVYPVTVRVTDDGSPALDDSETINITVNEVNVAPVAVDDLYNTPEDTALVVAAPGVLTNDSDSDIPAQTLSAVLQSGPANGTLMLNADGSFVYTPTLNFNGADSFTYVANDGLLDSNIATVNLTVDAANDAPVADDQAINTPEDTAYVGLLTASDMDGDSLTFSPDTAPPTARSRSRPARLHLPASPGLQWRRCLHIHRIRRRLERPGAGGYHRHPTQRRPAGC
jgi:VCBS repeat-containing protein